MKHTLSFEKQFPHQFKKLKMRKGFKFKRFVSFDFLDEGQAWIKKDTCPILNDTLTLID